MNKNKIILLLTIIFIVIISIVIYIRKEKYQYENLIDNNIFVDENTTNNNMVANENYEKDLTIKVHITGEINSPGLYELDEGSRINDLILLAGGQTENANLDRVNLAYELSDGEKIYIPSIFEEVSTYIYNDAGENVSKTTESINNSGKININKATSEELQKVSGIGPSLAEKIISYRNSNGKFNSIEDLKNISGIGDKKFETIKEHLIVK